MGEAKRRKQAGLPAKQKKQAKNSSPPNMFQRFRRNQILPVVIAAGFAIFLVYDLIKYYTQS